MKLWWLLPAMAVLLSFVAVVVSRRFLWQSPAEEPGFREFVKNLELWDEVRARFNRAGAIADEAERWSDEKVAETTRSLVLRATAASDAWEESAALSRLGTRTHATVLKLLADPDLRAQLVKPTGKDLVPEAPFDRACELLGDTPPVEAIPLLTPFLDDPSKRIRSKAAYVLGKSGAAATLKPLQRALSDQHEDVRHYAIIGLEFSVKRPDFDQSLREELFAAVQAELPRSDACDRAANVLFQLDSERATEFFLSTDIFKPDFPRLYKVLEVLADARFAVPAARLRSLIESLNQPEIDYRQSRALAEALRLLGQQSQQENQTILQTFLEHPEKTVASGAAAGLLGSARLEGFRERIWDIEEADGAAGLTRPQHLYSCLFMCDAEICNGGFSQYFVNSSGNDWTDALSAFKELGFHERTAMMKEAIAFFGEDGPSVDRDQRQVQLSQISQNDADVFRKLEDRYYACSENIDVFVARYVLAHPDAFR